jgi:hypothetical protein
MDFAGYVYMIMLNFDVEMVELMLWFDDVDDDVGVLLNHYYESYTLVVVVVVRCVSRRIKAMMMKQKLIDLLDFVDE